MRACEREESEENFPPRASPRDGNISVARVRAREEGKTPLAMEIIFVAREGEEREKLRERDFSSRLSSRRNFRHERERE